MGEGTAISGADPAGLAAAYDEHAAALYGYCRWMRPDPEEAAVALAESFVTVAARPGDLAEPGRLRGRLYAAARDACPQADAADPDGLDEARRLLRDALASMDRMQQQVIELSFRHQLDAGEVAWVLEVRPGQVPGLAERARQEAEKIVGALVVVRAGPSCAELGDLLAGQDEPLTVPIGRLAARHVELCDYCAGLRPGALHLERLPSLLPLAALPAGLREPVLQQAAAARDLAQPPGPDGRAARRRGGIRSKRRAAAVVAAVTAGMAGAVTATVLTVSATPGGHVLAAQTGTPAAATGSPAGDAPTAAGAASSPPATPGHRSAADPLPSPAEPSARGVTPAKPAPARSAKARAPASSSPSASASASVAPAPTLATHPASPTATPTTTPTDTSSPTASASGT